MKAAVITANGGPEVFDHRTMPDPVPAPGEVLIDVVNASVNGADWKVRTGQIDPITAFPYILGRDFSGRVAGLGEGATGFSEGDAVFGVCDRGREGAYAEKLVIKADLLCAKPDWLSFEHAAAVALTGLTALVSVEDSIKLKPGETILIEGGAGGVGGFAVQLAKHIGATVLTTCSTKNLGYVRGLGADRVIDYTAEDVEAAAKGADAVFDTVGGEAAARAYKVLRPGGRAAFIASGLQAPPTPSDAVTGLRPLVRRDRPHLERILALLKSGAVTAPEITLYDLKDAAEAHRVSESRRLRGKLVFRAR
ncbi:MAG: NADP-dependent oxidoreductase [Rhodospirillales bacterium]